MPDITEVFVFVAKHPDTGEEGAVGGMMPDGSMMPLVAVDRERMEALIPVAQQIARETGPITVVRFERREFERVVRSPEEGG